jgi:diaminopimelate decarboxylase
MIERNNELAIGGVPAGELAAAYETPVYVYDAATIRDRYNTVVDAFDSHVDDFHLHYAVKANSNPAVLDLLHAEGAGFDCSSPAEIRAAREVGAAPEDILYTSAYTREDELAYAIDEGVAVNLDGPYLLDNGPAAPDALSFRVNPGIGDGDHGLVFAGEDAKFGTDEASIVDAYREAQEQYDIDSFGIHMMTGSNNRDPAYFEQVTETLLDIAADVSAETGIAFDFVDIGGGLGIPYEPDDEPLDIMETADRVTTAFEEGKEGYDIGEPELWMEPGRYLVGEAGVLLSRVTGVKESGKMFIGVDTGYHHMSRPMLLDAYHEIVVANDLAREPTGEKDVVGPICSNVDVLAEDRSLPDVERGDLLGVMNTGAYGYVMASNFNTRGRPPEVLIDAGEPALVRERESWTDIFEEAGSQD